MFAAALCLLLAGCYRNTRTGTMGSAEEVIREWEESYDSLEVASSEFGSIYDYYELEDQVEELEARINELEEENEELISRLEELGYDY